MLLFFSKSDVVTGKDIYAEIYFKPLQILGLGY